MVDTRAGRYAMPVVETCELLLERQERFMAGWSSPCAMMCAFMESGRRMVRNVSAHVRFDPPEGARRWSEEARTEAMPTPDVKSVSYANRCVAVHERME